MKKPTDAEAHKIAVELEKSILKVLNGQVDYIAMTALTYATATLIVQLAPKGASIQEQLDTCDSQLRSAVALLQKHKAYLDKHRASLN
jgi:hypothetical protein